MSEPFEDRGYGTLDKLRFLLYPTHLETSDLRRIQQNDAGVRWLG
jgi:hypothetical protein